MSFPLGGERDSKGERKEAVREMKVPKPRGVCLHRSYRGVRSALVVSPSHQRTGTAKIWPGILTDGQIWGRLANRSSSGYVLPDRSRLVTWGLDPLPL